MNELAFCAISSVLSVSLSRYQASSEKVVGHIRTKISGFVESTLNVDIVDSRNMNTAYINCRPSEQMRTFALLWAT